MNWEAFGLSANFSKQLSIVSALPGVMLAHWDTAITSQAIHELINQIERMILSNQYGTMRSVLEFLLLGLRHASTHYVLMSGLSGTN